MRYLPKSISMASSLRPEEKKPAISASSMSLTPEAFIRPVEIKEVKDERAALLTSLYESKSCVYTFNEEYKTQIRALCTRLHTLAEEHKIIDENLAEITAFPTHLFSLIETNPDTTPSYNIKQSLEKMIYLLQKKHVPSKDGIRARFREEKKLSEEEVNAQFEIEKKDASVTALQKQMVLEQTLPFLRVCNTGVAGHLDFTCQLLEGGNTLDDAWCDLRTKIVTDFGYAHIKEHKDRISEGAEIHVPLVLRHYALEKKNWGIRSDLEHVKDHFERLTYITPTTLNKLDGYFAERYHLRSMTDVMTKKFEELFFKKYRLPHPGKEEKKKELRTVWVPFKSEMISQAEDILKEFNFDTKDDFPAGKLFEVKEDSFELRFSPQRVKQLFWQYCQRKNRYVDKDNWVEKNEIFADYRIMHAKSAAFSDLSWIEDKTEERNVIPFETLSHEVRMQYFVSSLLQVGIPDPFHFLTHSSGLFEVFHEKESLVALAKKLERENALDRHPELFRKIFRERPRYLMIMLEAIRHETVSTVLDWLEIDFYWLHPKHDLHKKANELPMLASDEKLSEWMAFDRLKTSQDQLARFQAEHKLDPAILPVPYSELLKLSGTVRTDNVDNQYIFKLYLQQYFPADFRKISTEEKPNYIKAFKVAHEQDAAKKFDTRMLQLQVLARDGNLIKLQEMKVSRNESYSLSSWMHKCQQKDLLAHFYREAVKDALPELQLFCAAGFGQTEDLKTLLAVRDIHVNCQFWGETTPLSFATENNHFDIVCLLLEKNASINTARYFGETPLYSAAQHGHLDIVRLLLARGAHVDAATIYNGTPLFIAAENGHLEIVRLFLERGASISVPGRITTPFHIAVVKGYLEIVRLFLEKGASVDMADYSGATPLYVAAQCGHLDILRLLLERGASLTATRYPGHTPLLIAAKHGHLEILRLLLERGACVNTTADSGMRPLFVAAYNGHLDIVQLLLAKGAIVSAAVDGYATPLHAAARGHHSKIVRLLLEKGSFVNAVAAEQGTPLYLAARHNDLDTVRLLLENGADCTLTEPFERIKPFDATTHPQIKQLLLAAEIKLALKKIQDINSKRFFLFRSSYDIKNTKNLLDYVQGVRSIEDMSISERNALQKMNEPWIGFYRLALTFIPRVPKTQSTESKEPIISRDGPC